MTEKVKTNAKNAAEIFLTIEDREIENMKKND